MDIRQLRYFIAIAEERQLTRAARRLHMAQPPLSRQLALMEQELSVTLFERSGREMYLTEEGKLLYRTAKNIINQLEEAVVEIKDTRDGLRGVLNIGIVHSCIPFVSRKISYFRENYPLVTLKMEEDNPSYLCRQLEERDIELAIIRAPFKKDIFSSIRLPEDPFVLVTPVKWEFPDSKVAIRLHELKDIPLLLLPKDKKDNYQQMIVRECDRMGIELDSVCECPDTAVLLMLIMDGVGASILPKSLASYIPQEFIKVMDILDFPFKSESALIWLKNRQLSKSAIRFIEC